MATIYEIHPDTPQQRRIEQISDALKAGAVMLYPSDTVYAIGCDLNHKSAIQRVRLIKQLSNDKPLTFLCPSLSDIARYAVVSDPAYRIMRKLVPGPVTFILPATKLVPKLVMNPKRKTTGIRVPDNPICQALLLELSNPIISTSANLQNKDESSSWLMDRASLFDYLSKHVDIILDNGVETSFEVSTILDLTTDQAIAIRQGLGWEQVKSLISLVE